MINYVVRFLKRFAVLIPGIVIAYFSVRTIFPLFDKRLPLGIAIFFTYVVAAYVLTPALIRLIRIFMPAKHLPMYCITPDGFASDPLNIALIGSREQLIKAMQDAGWHVADRLSPRNILRQIVSAALKRPYPTAPMSRLYLFGRKQDVGFEIPLNGSRGHRHHVRFWATTYEDGQEITFHSIHWSNRRKILGKPELLWVGAASRDTGFGFIRHNVQLTHMIDPDTNTERNLITKQLLDNKSAKMLTDIHLGQPYRLINRVWRGYLQSDGLMRVLKLK